MAPEEAGGPILTLSRTNSKEYTLYSKSNCSALKVSNNVKYLQCKKKKKYLLSRNCNIGVGNLSIIRNWNIKTHSTHSNFYICDWIKFHKKQKNNFVCTKELENIFQGWHIGLWNFLLKTSAHIILVLIIWENRNFPHSHQLNIIKIQVQMNFENKNIFIFFLRMPLLHFRTFKGSLCAATWHFLKSTDSK